MEIPAFSKLSRSRGYKENETNVENPNVTIAKAGSDEAAVTLKLAVNKEGGLGPPVEDTMMIDVYDDACLAARIGKGLEADYPADFDGNCIINLEDFVVMATTWLVDYTLTEPVVQ